MKLWLSLALISLAIHAESWKAGVAQSVITPTEPIWMAGYGDRKHESEGVLRDLYVKALALESEPNKPVVIVTADLLGFPREISDAVAAQCKEKFGLTRDRLVLNASHTHSAPVAHRNAFPIFRLDESQLRAIDRYSAFLIGKTVATIGAALADLAPANVRFEQGFAGIAVNRRRTRGRRNLPGPVDHDVPVLRVEGANGAVRAILVGYACHATVLNGYLISGDWPGFAQQDIERAHPGAIALFMQGCGADANPLPRRSVQLARDYGQVLAAAVEDVLKSSMKPIDGPLRTAYAIVDVPFQKVPTHAEFVEHYLWPKREFDTTENFAAYDALLKSPAMPPRVERLLDAVQRDGKLPDKYPYPVEVWQFGSSLTLIALGGEVVSDYSLRLKARYGWDNTWVAGYNNDVFGYVPTARILEEGDYEAVSSGYIARFGPEIEERIVSKVAELVARTNAPAKEK